jgi:hypothetical protein
MAGWGQVFGGPKVWVRDIVFTFGVALTVSLLGPFGSYAEPLQERLVRSFAYGFFGGLWIWPVMRLVIRAGVRAGFPELFTMVAGLVVLSVPVAAISRAIARLLSPDGAGSEPVQLFFGVLTMVVPFGLGYLYLDRWIERASGSPAPKSARHPRLFDRLPPQLGREVLALQAEDHYVRVHTRAGSTLLLMRLADAIAELDGLAGLRTHRSWWVAHEGVAAARIEGRRAVLTLRNGVEAPVTRESVPELRRAGWL